MDKNCVGCFYYWRGKVGWEMCDYFEKVGRLRPCKPGKDCTVKVIKKREHIPLEISPKKKV